MMNKKQNISKCKVIIHKNPGMFRFLDSCPGKKARSIFSKVDFFDSLADQKRNNLEAMVSINVKILYHHDSEHL